MANIQDMTPVEIDTVLAKIGGRQAQTQAQILTLTRHSDDLQRKMSQILNGERIFGVTTPADGIRLAQTLEHTKDLITTAFATMDELFAEAHPYDAEYTRRGGWNRVYLATSNGGHAHNGTECSTCHHGESRTGFAWLVRYSGKPESEIVADAGQRACTTCYPSAPISTLGRPTKMFTPDEEEAAKAREAREVERARKAADADTKSITTPEGGRVDVGRYMADYAKTVRTAEIGATDALYELIREQQHSVDPEWAWYYEDGRRNTVKEQREIALGAWHILRSIAFKKGVSFQEVFETHEVKAQAKIPKIDREWAKDLRNPNRTK